ncbi:unnamed protein product [Lampetra fluviatilis]
MRREVDPRSGGHVDRAPSQNATPSACRSRPRDAGHRRMDAAASSSSARRECASRSPASAPGRSSGAPDNGWPQACEFHLSLRIVAEREQGGPRSPVQLSRLLAARMRLTVAIPPECCHLDGFGRELASVLGAAGIDLRKRSVTAAPRYREGWPHKPSPPPPVLPGPSRPGHARRREPVRRERPQTWPCLAPS